MTDLSEDTKVLLTALMGVAAWFIGTGIVGWAIWAISSLGLVALLLGIGAGTLAAAIAVLVCVTTMELK